MEVYGEYLFLENLLMNFIILHITGYFSKYQGSNIKIVLGAIVGALYSFVIFFPNLHFLLTFSMKLVVSMLIIVISFTPETFKKFFKYMCLFYLISFIFGGTTFAIFYFTNFNSIVSNGIFYTDSISIRILMYSAAIGYILILISMNYIKSKISKEKILKKIVIEFDRKKKCINALIDTGNSLSDPISKFPVVIVEYSAIEELLPEEIRNFIRDDNLNELEKLIDILSRSRWVSRFRIIPYTSLGKQNGILIGFKPDYVEMEDEGKKISIDKTIIGISTNKLSRNGDYKALINPDILV
ncbi:sigma-E processing peptidase SpoIIGA [Caminicella sporogenes]|nr:sigma-E processing peptidase SpoIIGA [Caminicella sporogenes]